MTKSELELLEEFMIEFYNLAHHYRLGTANADEDRFEKYAALAMAAATALAPYRSPKIIEIR